MNRKIGREKVIQFGLVLIGVIIVSIYMFENVEHMDSEELVVSPMIAEILDLEIQKDGFGLGGLFSISDPEADIYAILGDVEQKLESGYTYGAYRSQIGLQGILCCIAAKIIPKLGLYCYLRLICCLLFVSTIFLILMQLYKKYGLLFSLIFGVTTFASPWVLKFSRNLYWVEFTWFIPMLLGIWCLNDKNKRKFIYPLFFLAIFVKCLCGYEYLSTVMMSGILFLVVEWICNKKDRKELTKVIFIVGICSLLGFVVSYIIHAFLYGKGDIIDGLQAMQVHLIQRRTFGNATDFAPVYTDSLNASILDVLKKYFFTIRSYSYGILFVITVIALIYQRKILKKNNVFEISIFVVALWSTISWFILGKSHSYIHTHLNFVMFYMGWVQISCYIICKVILESKKMQLKLVKKEGVIEE